MNEHDLDDILDDALDDLEEDKNAKNVAHVFTPAAPQKSSNNSSNNAPANNAKQAPKIASSVLPPQVQQQQQQQQSPPNAPSAKDFQEFLKTFSANRENLVKEDANNAAASNFDPQQLNDADVDLEKLFENMGEDEKKMINAFAQEMDKFFNEVAQKAPLPQDKPQQQQQKPAKKLNPNDPDAPELEDENDEDQKQQQGLKASIEETLNLLAKNSKEMKDKDPNSILNEEADDENVKQLMDMFGKMMGEAGPQDGAAPSGGEDGGAENEQQMFSVLEKLMESLMAPDVLRTPMEQLRKLYPDYLERNKDKLSKEEFERIKQQLDYANQICNVYETQQFPTCMPVLIELMRKMQELGQPPEELIAQLEPKGGNGPSMPSLPDLPGKCGMQ